MKVRAYKSFFLLILFMGSAFSNAQFNRWQKSIDFRVAPNYGYRLMGEVTPSAVPGSVTKERLKDSFSKNDKGYQTWNFGFSVVFKKTDRKSISFGLTFMQTGFTREKDGNMFNYRPHPDLEVYAQLAVGPAQVLNYDFKQNYLAIDFAYLGRIDGVNLSIDKTKLYYLMSVSPAVLMGDELILRTQGFTLAEGNNLSLYDYTTSLNSQNQTVVSPVKNISFNAFVGCGLRAEYDLGEKWKLLLQPKVQMAIFPNHSGVQTAWALQSSLDLGFVYPL